MPMIDYECAECGLSNGTLRKTRDGLWLHPHCEPGPVCNNCFLVQPCECEDS